MWSIRDNGDDIDWKGAKKYCDALTLGGFADWRLPTIDELEQLSERTTVSHYKIKNPLKLSGCCLWADSRNAASAQVYAFNFGQPMRYHDTLNCRALCVRRAGVVTP